jgi:predicted nucleic acid-binding protein
MNVVIDTQTLLDWRFFRDARCAAWALPQAGWWLATAAMRDELAQVLARPWPDRWATPASEVLAFFDQHTTLLAAPLLAVHQLLRCSDPDDQKFIDLALALRPALLISRDRALLKLAGRAALRGVQVLPPERWAGFTAPAGAAAPASPATAAPAGPPPGAEPAGRPASTAPHAPPQP